MKGREKEREREGEGGKRGGVEVMGEGWGREERAKGVDND